MANYKISVRTESGVKTTPDRFDRSIKTYQANVFAISLAQEKTIKNHPNPRDTKPKSDESLIEAIEDTANPDVFHLAANGIYLFANNVKVKDDMLEITMSDRATDLEGIGNGQHLLKAIIECFEDGSLSETKRVPVTIYTGLTKESKLRIVYGLNNNVEVNEDSHMNIAGKFNLMKKMLKDTPYTEEYVSYYQNDTGVQTVLGMIQMMKALMPNVNDFDWKEPAIPKMAYGNAQVIRREFKENNLRYKLMTASLPQILKFRDVIQASIDTIIESNPTAQKQLSQGEKPLALTKYRGKTPTTNQFQTIQFGGDYPTHILNNGILLPLLSAFRVFVSLESEFDYDKALLCWNEIGEELVDFCIRGCNDHEEIRKFASADTTWTTLLTMVKTWSDRQGYSLREDTLL